MEQQHAVVRVIESGLSNWAQWQRTVLALLRADVSGVLRCLELDEVDWEAWRCFYLEGRSPQSAIDRALARDF